MLDSIINGDGDSRYLKSAIPAATTWADALTMLRNGTFPIDLYGINADGFSQVGTPLTKAALLTDALAAAEGLDQNATLVDFLTALEDKVDHGLYYRAEDTFVTNSTTQFAAMCNNSGTGIVFTVPVPKSLENINSISVTTCKGIIYGLTGRVDGRNSSSYSWLSSYTVAAEKLGDYDIRVTITTSGSYTGTGSNQPLIASLQITLEMA